MVVGARGYFPGYEHKVALSKILLGANIVDVSFVSNFTELIILIKIETQTPTTIICFYSMIFRGFLMMPHRPRFSNVLRRILIGPLPPYPSSQTNSPHPPIQHPSSHRFLSPFFPLPINHYTIPWSNPSPFSQNHSQTHSQTIMHHKYTSSSLKTKSSSHSPPPAPPPTLSPHSYPLRALIILLMLYFHYRKLQFAVGALCIGQFSFRRGDCSSHSLMLFLSVVVIAASSQLTGFTVLSSEPTVSRRFTLLFL